jgi:hypothetical protein
VEIFVIYYKNGQPVWYDEQGLPDEIAAGSSVAHTFSKPHFYSGEPRDIDFDSYKVIINEAHKSKSREVDYEKGVKT